MVERGLSEAIVADLVETGRVKRSGKDSRHLWIFKEYPNRSDNLVCAAAVEGNTLIIKTLMTHWQEHTE
jgi:hypothetical protein